MESITHRKFGVRVEFDFYRSNGIFGAHPEFPKIKWESINCVIGYTKTLKIFYTNFGITIAFKDKDDNLIYCEVLSTNNEWEYRYFLERTVSYLKKKCAAIGGESWCTIFADERLSNYYNSYICCRTLADKQKIAWFEQNEFEHTLVANDFLNHVLVPDGTEVSQIWTAMEKTRFKINRDGSFDIVGTYGHDILYQRFLEMQSTRNENK